MKRIPKSLRLVVVFLGSILVACNAGNYKAKKFESHRSSELSPVPGARSLMIMDFSRPVSWDSPGWFHFRYWTVPASEYTVVKEGDKSVLRIHSDGAASILVRYTNYSLEKFPGLQWYWKVTKGDLKTAAETMSEGDDHPARIFLAFKAKGRDQKFLELIWANEAPVGRIIHVDGLINTDGKPFPHYVVRSGSRNFNRWILETVDLSEIYRNVWGGESVADVRVSGVAVISDSDDTDSEIEAFFADIKAVGPERGRTESGQPLPAE